MHLNLQIICGRRNSVDGFFCIQERLGNCKTHMSADSIYGGCQNENCFGMWFNTCSAPMPISSPVISPEISNTGI